MERAEEYISWRLCDSTGREKEKWEVFYPAVLNRSLIPPSCAQFTKCLAVPPTQPPLTDTALAEMLPKTDEKQKGSERGEYLLGYR